MFDLTKEFLIGVVCYILVLGVWVGGKEVGRWVSWWMMMINNNDLLWTVLVLVGDEMRGREHNLEGECIH